MESQLRGSGSRARHHWTDRRVIRGGSTANTDTRKENNDKRQTSHIRQSYFSVSNANLSGNDESATRAMAFINQQAKQLTPEHNEPSSSLKFIPRPECKSLQTSMVRLLVRAHRLKSQTVGPSKPKPQQPLTHQTIPFDIHEPRSVPRRACSHHINSS